MLLTNVLHQTQTFLLGISLEQSITQAPIISNQKKTNHWTLCRFLNYETIQNKKWGCDTLKYLIKNQPPQKWGKQWVYTVVYTVSLQDAHPKGVFPGMAHWCPRHASGISNLLIALGWWRTEGLEQEEVDDEGRHFLFFVILFKGIWI